MERVNYEKNTVQDLLNFYKADELELNPWYQRRAVWTDQQKSYLINTFFEQKPVPTIYIRHTLDLEKEKSLREVVDGQQRLRSIIDYRNGEFAARHPKYTVKKFFNELKPVDKEAFLMTSLSVGYLIGAEEPDVIEIFGRINSVSKTLNAQEKRSAQFSGEFKQFTIRTSSQLLPVWRSRDVFSATQISRMVEVEFIADLTMNLLKGIQDFSPARLTNFYKLNDVVFEQESEAESLISSIFSLINAMDPKIIKDTIFSRAPLMFSLCMILKDNLNIAPNKLSSIILKIDNLVVSEDIEHDQKTLTFLKAISSSTQRIASRRQRDAFIREYFN